MSFELVFVVSRGEEDLGFEAVLGTSVRQRPRRRKGLVEMSELENIFRRSFELLTKMKTSGIVWYHSCVLFRDTSIERTSTRKVFRREIGFPMTVQRFEKLYELVLLPFSEIKYPHWPPPLYRSRDLKAAALRS